MSDESVVAGEPAPVLVDTRTAGQRLREEGALLIMLAELQDELDAAREKRAEDPERWTAAKEKYASLRTDLRVLRSLVAPPESTSVAIGVEGVNVAATPHGAAAQGGEG